MTYREKLDHARLKGAERHGKPILLKLLILLIDLGINKEECRNAWQIAMK